MAGLSAAGRAAENGARVVVIEKAPHIGGSAIMSGGILWTSSSEARMRLYGGGSATLGEVVRQGYPEAIGWLKKRGHQLSRTMKVLSGFGYQINIVQHLEDCRQAVERNGGYLVCETNVETLLKGARGEVVGVRTTHPHGNVDVLAPYTLLATGGYQGSADLRARYIHKYARDLLLRANPYSTGEGIALGLSAGGFMNVSNRGFYGHLVSKAPRWGEERLFTMLAQYHSEYGLLFNENGERFCDESSGDHSNTYHTAFQPNARALLLWDRRIHERHATVSSVPGQPAIDKFAVAVEHGGEGEICHNLAILKQFATKMGFNGERVIESLLDFNSRATTSWETLAPPRTGECRPFDKPELYLLVVYPAITYTFGGLSIDSKARVLDATGVPVSGLLAAGCDVGDVYGVGYAGGLAQAMTLGMVAAGTAGW
jgi:succinate dehydrogenase/fumarate reductase flavoprotein subunit